MKPAKPVGEPTGEEKTESLQNTSAAVIRKGASEKSETAKQQKSEDNAGPNGRIQAKAQRQQLGSRKCTDQDLRRRRKKRHGLEQGE